MVISSKGCHGDTILLYDKTGPIPSITIAITKHKSVFASVCGIAQSSGDISGSVAVTVKIAATDAAHVNGVLSASTQAREGMSGAGNGCPSSCRSVKRGGGRQAANLITLRGIASSRCCPGDCSTVRRLSRDSKARGIEAHRTVATRSVVEGSFGNEIALASSYTA